MSANAPELLSVQTFPDLFVYNNTAWLDQLDAAAKDSHSSNNGTMTWNTFIFLEEKFKDTDQIRSKF